MLGAIATGVIMLVGALSVIGASKVLPKRHTERFLDWMEGKEHVSEGQGSTPIEQTSSHRRHGQRDAS